MVDKLVIFFCCYLGNATEDAGVIIIYPDSVYAFNTTWVIKEKSKLNTYGEKIYGGVFYLEHSEIPEVHSTLTVGGTTVSFTVEGVENANMRQLIHTDELYAKYFNDQ